jgi:hypothetical protein
LGRPGAGQKKNQELLPQKQINEFPMVQYKNLKE